MAIRSSGGASGGAPSGSAGGDLGGSFPNPTVLDISHVNAGTLAIARGGTGQTTATAAFLALAPAWVGYIPTFTGFGTVVTTAFYSMTLGKLLLIHGSFTAATSTATEGRVSIPTASSANIATIETCGNWIGDGPGGLAGGTPVLMEASKAYVTFGYQGVTAANGKTKQNGSSLAGAGSTLAFFAMIPID